MRRKKPLCLIIMDGWGVAPADERNALAKAHTPNLDKYFSIYPNATLKAHGLDVGLPKGTQGNSDMVGHTGVLEAVIKAAHVMDACVGAVTQAALEKGGAVIITAGHGNAECMLLEDGSPMTAHTTNPVPVIVCGMGDVEMRRNGRLCDLAPTLLKVLEIAQPKEMTGKPLF